MINNEPDGTNINTNCGSTHIEILQGYVKENHLDVGFAYDGDADRCIAVDENGQVVDGDLILYVCGQYLKKHGDLNNNTDCYNCNVQSWIYTKRLMQQESLMRRQLLETNMLMRIW